MTDQALDKLMRQVLIDSLALEVDGAEQVKFTPSKRHQQQIQALLKNPLGWYKRKVKPVWKLALQRVAVVLLVASLGFGSVMVVSPTARAAVIRWVVEWYETYIVFRYSGEQITKGMSKYEITQMPDGFIETDRIENSSSVSLFYEDGDGGVICFDYIYMHQGAATLVTTDNNVTDVTINGLQGYLLSPTETKSTTTVTWVDSSANIQFVIDTSLNQDNAIALAESVSPVEKKSLMLQYEIGALPDGYRETDYVVLPANVSATYENSAGDMICLDYVYMMQGAAEWVETDGSDLIDVMVNGCKGSLFLPDDPKNFTTLTWIDPEQNLQFCIDAVGDKETLIRLAGSITLKDPSKGENK